MNSAEKHRSNTVKRSLVRLSANPFWHNFGQTAFVTVDGIEIRAQYIVSLMTTWIAFKKNEEKVYA